MTKPHRHERAYREALAVFAARAPRALPADPAASAATLEAWTMELLDRKDPPSPKVVLAAVKRVTATEKWPGLPELLAAVTQEQRRLRELEVPRTMEASRQLAANASADEDWAAAGYATMQRFAEHLGTVRKRFDFDAEHRAEYERRKAAKETTG